MKRKYWLFLCLACSFSLLTSTRSFADDNGSLQLNPSVITNSNGGVGMAGDFPVRSQLFTSEMNQLTKIPDKVPEQRKALNFSGQTDNALYTNTTQVTRQLFINYKPQVITSNTDKNRSQSVIWDWVLALVAIPLVFLAVFLGQKNAKRSLRRKR